MAQRGLSSAPSVWKGFEKNEHACSVEGVLVVSDPSVRQYLKVAGPTRKIQSLFKLRQVLKWKAEIQDTPLGLTGIDNL